MKPALTNCWEFKKCGREVGGSRSAELGPCRAATETRIDGFNGGVNGGRVCWALAGTMCGGCAQGTFAVKLGNCAECAFCRSITGGLGKAVTQAVEVYRCLKIAS